MTTLDLATIPTGGRVEVQHRGVMVSHRGPGPWTVEVFGQALAAVLNAQGINWTSGRGGATLFGPEEAQEFADALNAAGGATGDKARPATPSDTYLAALVAPMTARQVAAHFGLSGKAVGGVATKLSAMVRRGLLRFNRADGTFERVSA